LALQNFYINLTRSCFSLRFSYAKIIIRATEKVGFAIQRTLNKGEFHMKSNLKRLLALLVSATLAFTMTACNGDDGGNGGGTTAGNANQGNGTTQATQDNGTTQATQGNDTTQESNPDFDMNRSIHLITRDASSGTRGALVYLAKIYHPGTEDDAITNTAEIARDTNAVLTSVENNEVAIGYISFGSLNNNVRAVGIDGVAATNDNILNETYALQRPFNVVNKGDMNNDAQDFWNFMFSSEGQAIVSNNGYVVHSDNNDAPAFESNGATGRITVGGSTSVQSLMDRMVTAYAAAGGKVTVEVQPTGSGAGESQTLDGTYHIGMVSREVRSEGLTEGVLAIDGIAVIVNTANPTTDIAMEDLRAIFMGEFSVWAEV
jgi:phosphate transport system substrate-binding protein